MEDMDADAIKAAILTPGRVDETGPGEPVQLPTLGVSVRVRGLSRKEVLLMRHLQSKGILDTEEKWESEMLSRSLVSPTFTPKEILEWQALSPAGEMNPVSDKVRELSALTDDADKSGVQAVREESGD